MENVESASPFTYSRYWLANLRPSVLTTQKSLRETLQLLLLRLLKLKFSNILL